MVSPARRNPWHTTSGGADGRVIEAPLSGLHPGLARCRLELACDVDNPLLGPRGANAVFGPQKGADGAMVVELEGQLRHLCHLLEARTGWRVREIPGAGAAGGMAAVLLALTPATPRSGIELVLAATGFAAALAGADLVIELASASEAGPWGAEALRRKLAAPSAACANPSEVGAVVAQQRLENATRLEGGDVLPGLVLELEEIWAG